LGLNFSRYQREWTSNEGERPKRGDIVIFYVPTNKRDHFVKRCVALEKMRLSTMISICLIHFHEGDEVYLKRPTLKE